MSNIYGGDEVNALVIDVGSYSCKAGYAGDDAPKAVFPSHVGLVETKAEGGAAMEVDGAAPAAERKYHVGQTGVNFRRDGMEVVSPFPALEDKVSDWNAMEAIWEHAIRDRLRCDPSEYALLCAEPNSLPREDRERHVELLFEKFKVPALFLAKNAVLSAFAMARQTALVVDAGYRYTSVAAVHDGFVLNKSITVNPVGGAVLNTLMQKALEARAVKLQPRYRFKRIHVPPNEFKIQELTFPNTTASFNSYQVEQVVADAREALCKVNEVPFEEQIHTHVPPTIYELPDGSEISVGGDRLKVPEVLFQPRLLGTFEGFNTDALRGLTAHSLDATVLESVSKCDVDVRRDLYQGVVLTGGVSLTAGLRDRLEKALVETGPQAGRFKVTMPVNALERKFSTWIGGSILASLGSFQQMWMSRKEYEEHGASLILQRAP